MERIYIVNPIAGKNKQTRIMQDISCVCDLKDYPYKIIETTKPGHATELASEFSSKDNVIFSVGGDGTLNEVVNGIKDKSLLGIIPSGSGNDFYKVIKEDTKIIDLGKVNDRYFINIASLGVDANVAYLANYFKSKGYSLPYVRGIIKALIEYSSMETNKGIFSLMAICNGSYYGNGINMAPFANISDGYLDLCTVDELNKIKIISLFAKLMKGTHMEAKEFHKELIESIEVDSQIPLKCNVDGEIIEDCHFKFELADKKVEYYHEEEPMLKKIMSNINRHK